MPTYNEIVCKGTSTILSYNGRTYTKNVSGFALCGYYYKTSGWTGPIVVSPTSSVARYDPYGTGVSGNVTINGTTWYYTGPDGWFSGNWTTSSGNYLYKIGSFADAASAATALINEYYKLVSAVSASVSPSGAGTVTLSNGTYDLSGYYVNGTNLTITATPNSKYKFNGFYNGSTLVSTSNPYTFSVSSAVNLTAMMKKKSSIRVKINGSWIEGQPYIKINGAWKPGLAYLKINGNWKEGTT